MFKLIKIILMAITIPPALVAALLLWIIKTSDVDVLTSRYPHYDRAKKEYVLERKKPSSWVEVSEVSGYAKWAIIVSEDWAFYEHPGVDLKQLKKAAQDSLEAGEFTRGASTITQQVVKNTLLTDERTLWRKFQEIILSLYLEQVATKDEILRIYLNIIELGDGIYGIKEGAAYYFSKSPGSLTAREGAFLAMLLPSPVKYSVSFYQKELTDFAREQVDSILVKLRQARIYNERERLRQSKMRFYWEKDFYQQNPVKDDVPSSYEDMLEEDAYL